MTYSGAPKDEPTYREEGDEDEKLTQPYEMEADDAASTPPQA